MDAKGRALKWRRSMVLSALAPLTCVYVSAQAAAQPAQAPRVRVTLDQAVDMALQHNHSLLAARSTILQDQALEVTANLRPNPVVLGDAQFLPVFQPSNFTTEYLDNSAQFDLGVSYLFERGKKRQHRLQAAQNQTAVTTAQVDDNGRTLTFNVAAQFIAALLAQEDLVFAQTDLTSFQQTVDISQASHDAGAMSEGDLLKIKLQLLQFQMDVSAAKLARVQALASLRQLLGYESVPEDYEVVGALQYQAVTPGEDDLKAMALRQRPDLRAAQLGVTAARSQLSLAEANGKRDVTAQFNATHVAALNTGSLFASIQLPIFDRNQGEIARTRYAITQSQELSSEQSSLVLTDVANSYEALRTADQVVQLYESGYRKQASDSRDISQYAYQRGGASLLDFLDAERTYRATELAYRQALATYMVALEQLRQAVGTRSLP
ncbi:MAG TPA: TolC family protein [Vicinamibacterales bacterium]|jgi:cobalt-zinc-cadmium efflux system outer membrane protein|nr:TolC family protein [Vicinamibacterales bacterium]